MKDNILYIRKCPGDTDPKHFKIGITTLYTVRSRLASYQNAVGPIYEECFLRVWLGDSIHIREAELQLKRNFAKNIQSGEAGLSEWISWIPYQDILNFIQTLRDEYFLKFIEVPSEFEPLTISNYEDLRNWAANQNSSSL